MALAINATLILVAVSVFHYQGKSLAGPYDAQTYHTIAGHIADDFRSGEWYTQSSWTDNHVGYYYWLGLLYTVFGANVIVGKLFNAVFLALTVVLVQSLVEGISGNRRLGVRASWLVALYTGLWQYTTILLKDDVIVFLITLAFWLMWHGLHSSQRSWWKWDVAVAVTVTLIVPLRSHVAIIILFIFLGLMGIQSVKLRTWRRLGGPVLVSVVCGVALGLMTPQGFFGWRLLFNQVDVLATDSSSQVRNLITAPATAATGSRLWQVLTRDTLTVRFWTGTAIGILRSVLSPLAWSLPGLSSVPWTWDLIAYPGMYIWYALLPGVILAAWRSLRRKDVFVLSMFLVAAAVIFIYSFTWVGSARHRDQVIPLMIVAAVAVAGEPVTTQAIYPVVWGLIVLGATYQAHGPLRLGVLLLGLAVEGWWLFHRYRKRHGNNTIHA